MSIRTSDAPLLVYRLLGRLNPYPWCGYARGEAEVTIITRTPTSPTHSSVRILLSPMPAYDFWEPAPYRYCAHGWFGDESLTAPDPEPSLWSRLRRWLRRVL